MPVRGALVRPYLYAMRTGEAILTIAGVTAVYFYTLKQAAGRLTFFPGNILSMGFDGPAPVMTLEITVQNTSNATLSLYSMAGNVYANGYLIGNVSSFRQMAIPGNSQRSIIVDIRFMLLGIVNDIITAFSTKNFSQAFSIEGTVNADGIAVPIKLDYKIGD